MFQDVKKDTHVLRNIYLVRYFLQVFAFKIAINDEE